MRIAVIGAGITGLSAAWLLSRKHEVVLFERNARFGGHANTIDVAEADRSIAIDTGFIVYNTACYPNLIALFERLGVNTAPTDMSFSVSLNDGRYEYNGNGVNGYFAQRTNLLSPTHWAMAGEIKKFFVEAAALEQEANGPNLSLGEWLAVRNYSHNFVERHIVPMGAAIWSAPVNQILNFPAQSFARFFANHGLLQMDNRPQWRTVRGGSKNYVKALLADFTGTAVQGDGVVHIDRESHGVTVHTAAGGPAHFDRCLIASHADEALALLPDATEKERRCLGAFKYASNDAVLHTDTALMPRRRRVWTSWNYLSHSNADPNRNSTVTYWMNKLQPLATSRNYFVSLNPMQPIPLQKILGRFSYEHPMFDSAALVAQRQLWSLQGRLNTWFAGSYFGYGFHEDALQAGLAAAEDMGGVTRPWRVEGQSDRLVLDAVRQPESLVAAQ